MLILQILHYIMNHFTTVQNNSNSKKFRTKTHLFLCVFVRNFLLLLLIKNPDCSTGPLARLLTCTACSFARTAHSFARSHRSHRSLVSTARTTRSFARSHRLLVRTTRTARSFAPLAPLVRLHRSHRLLVRSLTPLVCSLARSHRSLIRSARSFARSFAHTAHSFPGTALLALLCCTHSFAHLLTLLTPSLVRQ